MIVYFDHSFRRVFESESFKFNPFWKSEELNSEEEKAFKMLVKIIYQGQQHTQDQQ